MRRIGASKTRLCGYVQLDLLDDTFLDMKICGSRLLQIWSVLAATGRQDPVGSVYAIDDFALVHNILALCGKVEDLAVRVLVLVCSRFANQHHDTVAQEIAEVVIEFISKVRRE